MPTAAVDSSQKPSEVRVAQPWRTAFARNYAKAEYSAMSDEELEQLGVGALRLAVKEGDLEHGCFLSGQIAAMVDHIQPAAEIVRSVMEEAEPILKGAAAWVK